ARWSEGFPPAVAHLFFGMRCRIAYPDPAGAPLILFFPPAEVIAMHLSRSPYFFGFSALGLLLGAYAAGCGSNSGTHSTGTTTGTGGGTGGVGGTTTSSTTTGSGGTGGSTGTGFCGDGVVNGNGSEQCDLGS